MRRNIFSWWISRIRAQLHNLDILRVDHFRGFEAFWSIPYGEPTAVNGEWVKAPGHALFSAVRDAFEGNLPIIAEDLGIITPEVEALRDEFGFPGMKVLQFAFDSLDEGATCHTATHLQSAYVTPELMITTRLAAGIRHCARNAATKYAATHTATMIHIFHWILLEPHLQVLLHMQSFLFRMFCVSVQKDA